MIRSQIEFEIRERTGLRLGTYDIFMIRQKIYTGELRPSCEYLDERGSWNPLRANPLFGEVIQLMDDAGETVPELAPRTAPRLAGWTTNTNAEVTRGDATRTETRAKAAEKDPSRKKKGGLLGRFFSRK